MELDSIKDAHDHEDLIAEMVRDRRNWGRISLALANSVVDKRFKGLDFIDFTIMYKEPMN